ncbi:hypothetical protein HCN44_010801 [Aphidius gifuensis]|uniref:Myb/SANT-like DNA-binding domain-containing protein n=1 Tax=Aphidius gifuensis TaxID=684658 RepID=A0A834XYX1_APHGI|nr:hypothetical protein HCN44_010801 [Aphidius gifuensis]
MEKIISLETHYLLSDVDGNVVIENGHLALVNMTNNNIEYVPMTIDILNLYGLECYILEENNGDQQLPMLSSNSISTNFISDTSGGSGSTVVSNDNKQLSALHKKSLTNNSTTTIATIPPPTTSIKTTTAKNCARQAQNSKLSTAKQFKAATEPLNKKLDLACGSAMNINEMLVSSELSKKRSIHALSSSSDEDDDENCDDLGDDKFNSILTENKSNGRWTKNAVLALIANFEDHQEAMISTKYTNDKVWLSISNKMKEEGFSYNKNQCRDKFKKLKDKYILKKYNMSHNKDSGAARIDFEYYDRFDSIFGKKPTISPQDLASSSRGMTKSSDSIARSGEKEVNKDKLSCKKKN